MSRLPVIAVLTCERPAGVSYLEETLMQIDEQGGAPCERLLYVDGAASEGMRVLDRLARRGLEGWHVITCGKRAGNVAATAWTLRETARLECDVLFFEDDLVLCGNAVRRMLRAEVPSGCGFLSFFDMREFSKGTAPGIYQRHPAGREGWGFWGNQALRLPADMVSWLAYQTWAGLPGYGADMVLASLVQQHPTRNRIAFHLPCLVEHIGGVSACRSASPLRGRTATNFAGLDFDALGLP